MSNTTYTVNDLPRFSPWPARLLGLEPWVAKRKTPAEVTREYEYEKWGPLLAACSRMEGELTIERADAYVFAGTSPCLCLIAGTFTVLQTLDAHRLYRDFISDTLRNYMPASAVVELGCGYGTILLNLATRAAYAGIPFLAGEYTPSGVELTRRLAASMGVSARVELFDLEDPFRSTLPIPEDAIVYTSYTTPYVPVLSDAYVRLLAARRPRAVIHFEPCYEHCANDTLVGLLCRRYIEINDYNRNLVTMLAQQERLGRIRLVENRPAVFGMNPLLPASVVAWRCA